MQEAKELDPYQKSIAAKWDKESKKLEGGLFDTSRELEKTDTKQFNINVNNKLEFLTDLNNAGKLKKTYSDDQIENWTINPSITGSTIASKVKPKTKLKEAYSSMYGTMKEDDGYTAEDQWDDFSREEKADALDSLGFDGDRILHNFVGYKEVLNQIQKTGVKGKLEFDTEIMGDEMEEGSCGYGPDGVPGDTPGETKGVDADNRTKSMIQKLIQKEITKLSETDNTDSRFFNALNKAGFSDDEQNKITSKEVPSFANMKPDPNTPANPRTKDKHIRKPFDLK